MLSLKDNVKKVIYSGKPVLADEIIKNISKYKAVSFDLFDTLLKRNVESPSDLFEIMQINSGIKNFRTLRINAEKNARGKAKEKEITIDQIYMNIVEISSVQRDKLQTLELELEKTMLVINPEVFLVYRWCLENMFPIYITSDMYLPEKFIIDVLSDNGIEGFKKLYLSSSYKKVKTDGSLFEILLEEQSIKPSELVHIGDSVEGDYKIPKKMGIKAIRIPRYYQRRKYTYCFSKDVRCRTFNAFINNSEPMNLDNYQKFGFECFGPLLWGYVKWLYRCITEKGIKKVYFFSRDGLIMKTAFDICFSKTDIKTYYLEVSRRSLRVPVLWMDCSFNTVLNMLSPSKLITLETIFDGVGLSIDDYGDSRCKFIVGL
ncbi:HAD family hydrolase [uncultured Robinsoniella sp.]|uniref:HAD family hydrolase n=1 Tax=uncultured Robinsoniella sp. TaxID=904190 RepID=UPI00374E6D37